MSSLTKLTITTAIICGVGRLYVVFLHLQPMEI